MNEVKAAGVAVFRYTEEGRLQLLLVSAYGDRFGFPKGHVEDGESEIDAAVREVEEEVPDLHYELYGDVPPYEYFLKSRGEDGAPEMKTVYIFTGVLTDDKGIDDEGNAPRNWENRYSKFFDVQDIKSGSIPLEKSAKETILKAVAHQEKQ